MKLKSILLSMLALATLTSCNKENVVGDTLGGEETYAGINVRFPKMITKVTPDPNATTQEQAVTSLGVYIVGKDALGSFHSKVFASTEFKVSGEFYELNAALKTTTGDKEVFVVLNPTPAVISEIGSKSSPIFGALEFKSPYSNFYTANDFVMSSTVGVLKTLAVQTNEQALANPIDVAVQRNLAKVAVLSSNVSNGTFTTSAGHTASGLTFAPITRAINSYLIQQKNAGTSEIVTPGAAIVPEKDNNYWANTTAPLAAEYETVGVMAASNPDPKSYKCFYALENVNDKNYVGNTTAAIIKANMKLKDGTVVTGYTAGTRTFGNLAANQSFYVLKGDNTPWSEAAYTAALASTDFTAAHFTLKYDGGVSYYRIWVKDANDVVAIIRNNYYIMQINSISGIGSPIPPGTGNEVNPEDPIDEDTYISVKVSVQNWSTIVTGHDL